MFSLCPDTYPLPSSTRIQMYFFIIFTIMKTVTREKNPPLSSRYQNMQSKSSVVRIMLLRPLYRSFNAATPYPLPSYAVRISYYEEDDDDALSSVELFIKPRPKWAKKSSSPHPAFFLDSVSCAFYCAGPVSRMMDASAYHQLLLCRIEFD